MRVRSSVKWTARIGVVPGTTGSSVNGRFSAVTLVVNGVVAFRPPGSVAVTRITAVPGSTAVSVAPVLPDGATVTTPGADDGCAEAQRVAVGVGEGP